MEFYFCFFFVVRFRVYGSLIYAVFGGVGVRVRVFSVVFLRSVSDEMFKVFML